VRKDEVKGVAVAMRTILVDDDPVTRKEFLTNAEEIESIELVEVFDNIRDALTYSQINRVDLAVLDVWDGEWNGTYFGERLKDLNPDVIIIYITGQKELSLALEAIRLTAAAYLLRPYQLEDLNYALETAKLLSRKRKRRIYARTFGHFDLFVDGKPTEFKSAKAKELLALLVDRQGGIVTNDQAIGTLWDYRMNDDATQSLYSKVRKSLQNQLQEIQAERILIVTRKGCSLDLDELDCDLYQLLRGDDEIKKHYYGQYMADYSWAEYRIAGLERLING
jgi:two-component SAPR family response regulator